jgi:succinoglycan biosynthesis transport protein ExoP
MTQGPNDGDLDGPRLEFVKPSDTTGFSGVPVPGAASGSRPGYGYGSNVLGETEVHLIDYVKVLYKRRWTAITAFLIVVMSVAVYTFTATPIFEAKVQVLIEKENENVVTFKEAVEQNQITDDYYQTQYKILQSRILARRTLDALKLWDDPQFNSPPAQFSARSLVMAPIGWVRGWFPSNKLVDPPDVTETKAQSSRIDRFLNALTVAPIRNSRLVDVRFASPDAALSARVANTLATQYIQQNLEFKFNASKEASDWLTGQLAEQRKQVDASEQALQRYREQTDAVSLEDRQNIVVQKLSDLNAAVTRAKTDRMLKEGAYNQIKAVQGDRNALDTIPAILSNSFIQQQKAEIADLQRQQSQLSEKLGPNHPDMRKVTTTIQQADIKLQGEIAKVVQGMRNDYQAAAAQEQSLTAVLNQQKDEALALNRKGIDYGTLQRDATTNQQIFSSLLQRTKETGISGALKTSNIRIIDLAEVPRGPTSPNTQTNLLLALLGGATLAVGLAFFFEYLDNRIKTPDEIKQHLGLPFLGMVPALFDQHIENPLIISGVPSNFVESFRAVRTNVLFSSAEKGGRSVVVTSTGPGEGKTAVAANLGIALAQSGQRVLLIDADLRKPRIHTVFSEKREPGLSNVLVGTAKVSESVRVSGTPGLWILPAGAHPPNPAELLGSQRFRDFMTSMTPHFDWIVIDTPPVMAVTDASVVAHLMNGVLFVVGAEMTSRHAAQRALEQLEQARAKFIGAVLNRVDLQHNAYYYSQYYRREYTDYYQKGVGTYGRGG